MIKRISAILLAIVLAVSIAAITAYADDTKQLVFDGADLLTDSEEEALEAKLRTYSKNNGCDIVFASSEDIGTYSSAERYVEAYQEGLNYGEDGVLFLITLSDEDEDRRAIFATCGKCTKQLTLDEQNDALKQAKSALKDGDFAEAVNIVFDDVNNALPIRLAWYMLPLAILIGFAIAMMIMLIIRGKLKSVKMQRGAASYIRPDSMHVTAARDTYLYSTVSRTVRETNNRSSGGGGGGSSSAGASMKF